MISIMSTAIDIVNNLINSDESDNQEPVEEVAYCG